MSDNSFISQDTNEKWLKFAKYSSLIGGIIYMLFPGSLYIDGNISPYIATYYGVETSQTSNILLASLIGNCVVMPIGSYFVQKNVNPKLLIIIGGALCLSM